VNVIFTFPCGFGQSVVNLKREGLVTWGPDALLFRLSDADSGMTVRCYDMPMRGMSRIMQQLRIRTHEQGSWGPGVLGSWGPGVLGSWGAGVSWRHPAG